MLEPRGTMGAPDSRRKFLFTVGSLVAISAVIIISQVSLNVPFVRPAASQSTVLLFVLSMLVSLAFVVFGFILARNVLKLYIERRSRILGSKFKFKLVAGALALSVLPVMFLFYSSYALMNRTLDKWFRQPFEQITRDTEQIVKELSAYASMKTEGDAHSVAAMLAAGGAPGLQDPAERLAQAGRLNSVDYLALLDGGGRALARYPAEAPDILPAIPAADRLTTEPVRRVITAAGSEYTVAVLPLQPGAARLVAANRLPPGLSARLAQMNREMRNYQRLQAEFKDIRKVYINILALVTVIILFITTWTALFLSKQVTVPIQSLAEATQEVGRHQVETSRAELQRANVELDARSRFTEAILESIPSGVISLSPDQRVLKINSAVERLFGAERVSAAAGLSDLFTGGDLRALEHLLKRSVRVGTATSPFEMEIGGRHRNLAITVSSLQHPSSRLRGREQNMGYILVVEDMSDLLYAQQAAAWREVAQRIAHEIKNPLTPIALSAERIRRHVERMLTLQAETPPAGSLPGSPRKSPARHAAPPPAADLAGDPSADSLGVIGECSLLIEQEVNTLKKLVDEFAQLARFPAAHPAPSSINAVIENALSVFGGRLDGIRLELDLCPSLPLVSLDPEHFKRVIVNLVDNAAEAMEDSLMRELRISTADLRGEAVEVVVADTGHGVTPELKEKLFLPSFSTKRRGTGLGLAIVSRIIAEHNGSIRVEENQPVGARFIMELPVEQQAVAEKSQSAVSATA
ncbi:MAG: ATP-binding protein [Acidobacteria bacterium]|nr:ATP-binding protein [Acidobacteriota bacterium]